MEQRVGAVLTGGDFQGLGVIRSLGSKGIPIMLLDCEQCIGRFSRYTDRFTKSPFPANGEEYVNFLIESAKKYGLEGWTLFPNNDQIVYNISKHKEELSRYYKIPVPGLDVIMNVYDKNNTYRICRENNIPHPRAYSAVNYDEMRSNGFNYPLVIKPSVRDNYYSKVKKKAYRVNDRAELINTYKLVNQVIPQEEILVQEFIAGGPKNLYSFCPLFINGKVIASVTARRSRQHPMDFGHATTFAEIVEIPELEALASKFLSLINYEGVCEVEFMYDESAGEYKLIEVNPRIWGWHSLAIAAGVDLPYYLYLYINGRELPEIPLPQSMKWIRLTTDTFTALQEMIKFRLNLMEYLSSFKGKKEFAVLSIKDPAPFLMELLLLPYLWKKRGF